MIIVSTDDTILHIFTVKGRDRMAQLITKLKPASKVFFFLQLIQYLTNDVESDIIEIGKSFFFFQLRIVETPYSTNSIFDDISSCIYFQVVKVYIF